MPVRPTQNLPPGAQQWARSIEQDVDNLTRTLADTNRTQDNTLKGLATSLANLGTLVETLSEQQAQIAQAQADLQAQQDQILSILDNLVGYTSIDLGGYFGNLAVGSAFTTVGSGSLTLPAGATSALVYMTANGTLAGGGGSGYVNGSVRCVIAGSAGRSQLLETYTTAGAANASASQTSVIATPGTSIPVEIQFRVGSSTQTTSGYYTGDFSAFVIYTR